MKVGKVAKSRTVSEHQQCAVEVARSCDRRREQTGTGPGASVVFSRDGLISERVMGLSFPATSA